MVVCGLAGAVLAQEGHPPPMPPGGFPQGGPQRMQQFQMPQFGDLDKNKDKKLSKAEYAAGLSSIAPQMAQMIDRIFDMSDENKDGFVDETEWANGQRRMGGGGGPTRVALGDAMLRFLDKNTDTKVTAEEFSGLKALFTNLDRDTNGSLTVEELNPLYQSLMRREGGGPGGQGGQGRQGEGRGQGQGGQGGQGRQGEPGGQRQMMTFAEMDKNGDKKLTQDELPERMAPMIERLDQNKDGALDETEWNARMNRQGGPGGGPRIGETLIKFMDTNADSLVSPDEFARIETLFVRLDKDKSSDLNSEELNGFNAAATDAASEVQNKATGGIDVNQLFVNLDKNKDGKITPDEVTNEKAFKSLDLNGDGTVSKEEATESLKKQAEKRQKQAPPQQKQ